MVMLRRGDIVLVDFGAAYPFEAASTRPAIIVSNDIANAFMNVIIVIPLTSNTSSLYPHETFVPALESGLDRDSKAQPHLLRHINTNRIKGLLSRLPKDLLADLDRKMREHLAL
jgi:mRNA interferase MazF